MIVIEALYMVCLVGLSLYGFNNLVMILLYLIHRRDAIPLPPAPAEWPHVTVQLPIYNEMYTIERLLAATAAFDYPRERLEIQVLDDSTDETRDLVARLVEGLRAQGVDAAHLIRSDRSGYKAGALAEGLACAKGEFIAIFDADFVPQPDFLRRLIPHFADPALGCVQTRWGHINRNYSLLTRVEALAMDAIFVEQTALSRSRLFLNFNGSAGVWRRAAIEGAGGWSGDTLTEDLDLSYRAQLHGWRILYLPEVVTPGELPVQISAFKKQQARWAQGCIQTAFKLVGPVLRARLPWAIKLEAVLHLTLYFAHLLLLVMILLALPVSYIAHPALVIGPWAMVAALGAPLLYTVGQVHDGGRWLERVSVLPLLLLVGIGLALNNSWAMLKALLGHREGFQRTPKYALRTAGETWAGNAYALGGDRTVWGELGLALLVLATVVLRPANLGSGAWLLLYSVAFAYVAVLTLLQSHERHRWTTARSRAQERPKRKPSER